MVWTTTHLENLILIEGLGQSCRLSMSRRSIATKVVQTCLHKTGAPQIKPGAQLNHCTGLPYYSSSSLLQYFAMRPYYSTIVLIKVNPFIKCKKSELYCATGVQYTVLYCIVALLLNYRYFTAVLQPYHTSTVLLPY